MVDVPKESDRDVATTSEAEKPFPLSNTQGLRTGKRDNFVCIPCVLRTPARGLDREISATLYNEMRAGNRTRLRRFAGSHCGSATYGDGCVVDTVCMSHDGRRTNDAPSPGP